MCRAATGYGPSKILAKGRGKFGVCDIHFANHWKVTRLKSNPQEKMSGAQQAVLLEPGAEGHAVEVLGQLLLVLCHLQGTEGESRGHQLQLFGCATPTSSG